MSHTHHLPPSERQVSPDRGPAVVFPLGGSGPTPRPPLAAQYPPPPPLPPGPGMMAPPAGGGGSPPRTPAVKGATRLLLVGCAYRGDPTMQLPSATQDVRALQQYLTRIGFTPTERRVLTEDNPEMLPTRANILSALRWLVRGSVPGDSLFFHFAGHGGRSVPADAVHDTGLEDGEALAPVDYKTAGLIHEDELHDILVGCLASGARLTCLFDCVKVGAVLDLPYKLRATADGTYLQETPSPPIPSEIVTISYSSPSGAVNALTTAFIAACNAGAHVTYKSLVTDMAAIMARRFGGGLDPPAPLLSMTRAFEMGEPFLLSAIPDAEAAKAASEPAMTAKEEELTRRIKMLESLVGGGGGGGGVRSPPSSRQPQYFDPYTTPARQREATPAGAFSPPGTAARTAVSPGVPPPNRSTVYATATHAPDTEVAGASRAVFIGVEYRDTPFELSGAVKAMDTFQRLVMDLGFNARAQVLTEDVQARHLTPTRQNIVNALRWLVKDARAGDVMLLYFSGYGAVVPEYEAAGITTAMAPVDFHYRGFITADEVHNVLCRDLPHGAKVLVVSDLAHGGAVLQPPYRLQVTNGAMCYAHEPHDWVDRANAEVLALSAVGIEQSGAVGLFTEAVAAVLESQPQLEVGRLMHALKLQLGILLSGSPMASPLLQSSRRLTDRSLFFLGNRPQTLKPREPPPPQLANLTPHRGGGGGGMADPGALALSNMPGIYKVDGSAHPAAVAVDKDTGRVTLFSSACGERQGELAGRGTKIKLDQAWAAPRKDAEKAVTFAEPTSPDGLPPAPDAASPTPQAPPLAAPASTPLAADAEAKAREVTYNPSTGRLTFPDGVVWVHQGGLGQAGGGRAAPPASTPGTAARAEEGWGQDDNVPSGARHVQTILGASKALLVGVGYDHSPSAAARLSSPGTDVVTARRFLQRHGFRAETRVLVDGEGGEAPTRANIMSSLRWLARDAVPGDSLFFLFSGHGGKGARIELDDPVYPGAPTTVGVAPTTPAPPATPFAPSTPGGRVPNGDPAAAPVPAPYSGGGLGEETSIAPSDAHQGGVIDGAELLATFVPALPPGVRLTVVLDLDQGGGVVDLPFSLEALPNGGFSTKDHPTPAPSLPDIKVLYSRGVSGCNGALATAFMAVMNQSPEVSHEDLLTAMRAAIKQRVGDDQGAVGLKSTQRLTALDAFHLGTDSQQVLALTAPFPAKVSSSTRAVLVSAAYGDRLPHTQAALREVEALLVQKGYDRSGIRILTEPSSDGLPTKGNILGSMKWLTNRVEPGDSLFFYFAGYGVGGGAGRAEHEPPAAHGIAPMDFMTYGCISGAEVEEALLGTLPAGVNLTAVFDAPTTVVPAALPYVMVGERDGGTSFSHLPAADRPGKATFITTTPDQSLPHVVPVSGVLTVAFVQTVLGHGRDPTYGQLMQGLRSAVNAKVADSGHAPTILSTRRFADVDPFSVFGAGNAGGAYPPAAPSPARPPLQEQPAAYTAGLPPGRPPRQYSPERLNRLEAYHSGTAQARAIDVNRRELLESMRHIQQNIEDAVSVARGFKGPQGGPLANHAPQSAHYDAFPAGRTAHPRGHVSPLRPERGGTGAGTMQRTLLLLNAGEPLGMRLVPASGGMTVAAVTPHSAAQRAGIAVGDVVHSIASHPVATSEDVRTARALASQRNQVDIAVVVTPAAEDV